MKLTKLPSRACQWSWNTTPTVYDRLGIKANKIPKAMHGKFRIDGWDVVVKRASGMGRASKHRVFVERSGRLIPIGRVYQALCVTYKFRQAKRQGYSKAKVAKNLTGSRR